MNTSNMSFSKCSFSLRQFFVKSGLLSSRFFISKFCIVNFQTIGMNLSFKFTSGSQESLLCIHASTLQILPLRVGDLFVFQEPVSQHLPDSESLDNASFSPWTARCAKEIPSLSENVSWLDFLLCENSAASCPALSRKWDELDTEFSRKEWCTRDRSALASLSCKYSGEASIFLIWSSSKSDSGGVSWCSQLNHKSTSCSACGRESVWPLWSCL